MIVKKIQIGDKEIPFASSADIPRKYRKKFGRDIFKDIQKLEASVSGKEDGNGEIPIEDLEIFENVAYIMALHADPTIPPTIDEWLDQFDMFSIYIVLPQLLELWNMNNVTTIPAPKN